MELIFTFAKATKNCFAYECTTTEITGMLYIKQEHAGGQKPIKSFAVTITPESASTSILPTLDML